MEFLESKRASKKDFERVDFFEISDFQEKDANDIYTTLVEINKLLWHDILLQKITYMLFVW